MLKFTLVVRECKFRPQKSILYTPNQQNLSLTISRVAVDKFLVSRNNFFEKNIWHPTKVQGNPAIPLLAYIIEKVTRGGLFEIARNEKQCNVKWQEDYPIEVYP